MNRLIKNVGLVLVVVIFALFAIGATKKRYGNVEVSRVLRVYDGDTFYCDIKQWPAIVGYNIGVRINGIDTPEIRGSSASVMDLALQARLLVVNELANARSVQLWNVKRGKYFRLVADVYVDKRNLARILLNAGLAKRYDGGKRPVWETDDEKRKD